MIKKILGFTLAALICFAACGCGAEKSSQTAAKPGNGETVTTAVQENDKPGQDNSGQDKPDKPEDKPDDGKTDGDSQNGKPEGSTSGNFANVSDVPFIRIGGVNIGPLPADKALIEEEGWEFVTDKSGNYYASKGDMLFGVELSGDSSITSINVESYTASFDGSLQGGVGIGDIWLFGRILLADAMAEDICDAAQTYEMPDGGRLYCTWNSESDYEYNVDIINDNGELIMNVSRQDLRTYSIKFNSSSSSGNPGGNTGENTGETSPENRPTGGSHDVEYRKYCHKDPEGGWEQWIFVEIYSDGITFEVDCTSLGGSMRWAHYESFDEMGTETAVLDYRSSSITGGLPDFVRSESYVMTDDTLTVNGEEVYNRVY